MTSPPGGIRPALARLRPWLRRLVHLLLVWLGIALVAALLGLRPDVTQLGAALLAVGALGWYVVDHVDSLRAPLWPLTDSSLELTQRGGDYRVTNLAARLADAEKRPEGRAHLSLHLHKELSTIIGERLYAKHGITIEEEPRWAEGVMPRELWEFATGLPDPALYSPAHLDQILRRIEQW